MRNVDFDKMYEGHKDNGDGGWRKLGNFPKGKAKNKSFFMLVFAFNIDAHREWGAHKFLDTPGPMKWNLQFYLSMALGTKIRLAKILWRN